ncbi:group II intron maturase-specific domain-containing protein [Streptomyces sp. NPDC018587]|uniref:group II intron maturase-specific domain-containing protein n=1 Tax=unclassified Streptomyces TaxID=2593676 RepID=UPI00378A9F2B
MTETVRDAARSLCQSPTEGVVKRLNPVIKGWSTYYRGLAEYWASRARKRVHPQIRCAGWT